MEFRTSFDENLFSISQELLVLMAHIVDEYPNELHELIKKAQRTVPHNPGTPNSQEAHEYIIDFLSLMELLVYQTKDEVEVDAHIAKQLMPAIDHIDQTSCGPETVSSSIEHASNQKAKHPRVDAQELLYKELLRRWKPGKKTTAH